MTVMRRRLHIAARPDPDHTLKVLFLIDSLGPGGAERLMVDLLPRLCKYRIESIVVAIQERRGNPIADELRRRGVPVSTLGIERLRERAALSRVIAAIQEAKPDIIHTQLEFADILGSLAGSRLGIPTIATIHTLDRPRRWSKEALHFRLMAWTLRRRSNRVIAVSASARSHVLRKASLPKRHTTTIHNGIDLDPFLGLTPEQGSAVRTGLGINHDAPVVTTVAVLRQPKGIDDMLDALPRLRRLHPGVRYLIVGDGPHRSVLEAHARAAGVEAAVHFVGQRSDVPDMLAASDLFVLPSHTEALPTVLIEAMAAGLPVVATRVGGVPEIVDNSNSGLLVEPEHPELLADAIGRLLSAPRQRSAMGLAGRRIAVDRFSIDRQAARLSDEYRALVSRSDLP